MKHRRKKRIKIVMTFICFVGIISITRFWYLEEQGNFHVITPFEAYRSAQLDKDELEYYIHKFGIRSIINLRGVNEGAPWYAEETAISRELDVTHYDLGMSADRTPSSLEIEELLRLFRIAARPVLIHCKAGADRSGLAATLWRMVVDGVPKSVARKHLSIRYGHIPFGQTQALDAFLENWMIPIKTGVDAEKMSGYLFNRKDHGKTHKPGRF